VKEDIPANERNIILTLLKQAQLESQSCWQEKRPAKRMKTEPLRLCENTTIPALYLANKPEEISIELMQKVRYLHSLGKQQFSARVFWTMISDPSYPYINWAENGQDWLVDYDKQKLIENHIQFLFQVGSNGNKRSANTNAWLNKLKKTQPPPEGTQGTIEIWVNKKPDTFNRNTKIEDVQLPIINKNSLVKIEPL
jgi:hypothetical protein